MNARAALDQATSEKDWQAFVATFARFHGFRTYHTLRSTGSEPGFPDLVMIRKGRLIVAELKTERGKVTVSQQEWLDDFRAVEGPPSVHLWRPSHADEVMEVLK